MDGTPTCLRDGHSPLREAGANAFSLSNCTSFPVDACPGACRDVSWTSPLRNPGNTWRERVGCAPAFGRGARHDAMEHAPPHPEKRVSRVALAAMRRAL